MKREYFLFYFAANSTSSSLFRKSGCPSSSSTSLFRHISVLCLDFTSFSSFLFEFSSSAKGRCCCCSCCCCCCCCCCCFCCCCCGCCFCGGGGGTYQNGRELGWRLSEEVLKSFLLCFFSWQKFKKISPLTCHFCPPCRCLCPVPTCCCFQDGLLKAVQQDTPSPHFPCLCIHIRKYFYYKYRYAQLFNYVSIPPSCQ